MSAITDFLNELHVHSIMMYTHLKMIKIYTYFKYMDLGLGVRLRRQMNLKDWYEHDNR